MRICSLLPSATEILFALGLGEDVVGVSHECDFPPAARAKRRVIETVIDQQRLSSREIDVIVRRHIQEKRSLYRLDEAALLELRPELIVTQELCDVCAIDAPTVLRSVSRLPSPPAIVSLHPHTLDGLFEDIRTLGQATGTRAHAQRVVEQLRARLDRIRERLAHAGTPRRVACLEWMEPLMNAGHWVPEMVQRAGGRDPLSEIGKPSVVITWAQLVEAQPEVLVLMPCGFPIARTRRELSVLTNRPEWQALPAVEQGQVYAVDGPAYFNRSGPRLIDGTELLAGLFYPQVCGDLIPAGSVERCRATK